MFRILFHIDCNFNFLKLIISAEIISIGAFFKTHLPKELIIINMRMISSMFNFEEVKLNKTKKHFIESSLYLITETIFFIILGFLL